MCVNSGIKRCSVSNLKVCNYGPKLLIWCNLISYPGCKLHTSSCLLYFLLFWQGSLLRDAYGKMLLRSDKNQKRNFKINSVDMRCWRVRIKCYENRDKINKFNLVQRQTSLKAALIAHYWMVLLWILNFITEWKRYTIHNMTTLWYCEICICSHPANGKWNS